MNVPRFIISSIAVFVFVFLFEFLFHTLLLKDLYDQTAHLWRPEGEHKMAFVLMSQIFFSFIVVFIFTRNAEGKGICEGFRFGLYLGLVLGSLQLATYCYLPIPLTLTLGWVAAGILKGLGSGIISSLIYRS